MVIEFRCRGCKSVFRVQDDKAGGRGKCPKCQRAFVVPRPRSIQKAEAAAGCRSGMTLKRALAILGLPSRVTVRQARDAYRRLATKYHPDSGSERSAAQFIEIVAAYEYIKDHAEARKHVTTLPAVSPSAPPTLRPSAPPVYDLSYASFVSELEEATHEAIISFNEEKDNFVHRLKRLIETQISSYTSAREFRNRLKDDVDAVAQRELWAFLERIERRSQFVETRFAEWVARIRGSAYEIGLPHGMMDYLRRPGGLVLSFCLFLILMGSTYLAMYLSPLPFFDRGPVPILAGILSAGLALVISLWGGKAIYMRSARKRGKHDRAMLMAQVGFDSFQVGAVPASAALSSGERAGLAGAGMGVLTIWLGAEPLTGAIAIATATVLGWATGKSLSRMQKRAKQDIITGLEPRLDDFLDGFAHKILTASNERLHRMRQLYLQALGPDDSPLLQRKEVFPSASAARVGQSGGRSATRASEQVLDQEKSDPEAVLQHIRKIVGGLTGAKIHIAPNIPEEKVREAVDSYAQGIDVTDILCLYDNTALGGAKEGLCLTVDWLFWRNRGDPAQRSPLEKVGTVRHERGEGIFGLPGVVVSGGRIDVHEEDVAEVLARVIRAVSDHVKTSRMLPDRS